MGITKPRYVVDPADPRLPTMDVWVELSPEEQREVIESLPSEFEPDEASPPEGDPHYDAVAEARDALRGFFSRSGRRVYVGNSLPVYYPGDSMFSPDVIAVVDATPGSRNAWTVVNEGGKGVDLAVEILLAGNRTKDLRDNVSRYARLGIAEYFVFDIPKQRIHGYRLATPDAREYTPILAQGGAYACATLGLELVIDGGRLRFLFSGAVLPETRELLGRATAHLDEALDRAEALSRERDEVTRLLEEATRARDEATRSRDDETARRRALELKLAEALAENERLRLRGKPS